MKIFSKTIAIIILLTTFIGSDLKAQCVEQGNSIFSLGYGFPNLGKSIYKALNTNNDFKVKGIGPLHLKYEYMLSDNIGIGASINFVNFGATYTETTSGDSMDINENWIHWTQTTKYTLATKNYSALFRFNYHFVSTDNLDVYFGIGAGLRGGKTTYTSVPKDPDFTFDTKIAIPVGMETSLGMRYFFTENIGVYTEIGLGKSLIQFGGCFKL